MIKYGSIEQFRNVLRYIKEPTEFIGTVKLHGTNAGVLITVNDVIPQSRERELTAEQDNAGFYVWAKANTERLRSIGEVGDTIFGEWCGGNIQKGVAINQLPKMFVIFNITSAQGKEYSPDMIQDVVMQFGNNEIFSIYEFPTFKVTVDPDNPHLASKN